jgi:hypothetical protein
MINNFLTRCAKNASRSRLASGALFLVTASVFIPSFALAQAPGTFREFAQLIVRIVKYGAAILFVSLGVGLAYGVVVYLAHSDDAKMRENIKGYLLWAVIGIAVVFGLWGILTILSVTFGWGTPGVPIITPPRA